MVTTDTMCVDEFDLLVDSTMHHERAEKCWAEARQLWRRAAEAATREAEEASAGAATRDKAWQHRRRPTKADEAAVNGKARPK